MEKTRFFYRILLPSLSAILLFLAAMYLIVIPAYRETLMDKKRETISELTNTAWSIFDHLNNLATDSVSLVSLKQEAAYIIGNMRYGDEQKDYFWITDTLPRMIMHPYRHQLIGQDLSNFADPEGKKFFVEITELVTDSGDGYIDYKWQWKDDSLMVVPKLSYVKLYEPWGWIVGTGIYVEDVQREISAIVKQVVWISILITIIIGLIISYLAHRNYLAEQQRSIAVEKQREAMEKYKKLVETSSDGVLMTVKGEIVYCNPILMTILGFDPHNTHEKDDKLINSINSFFQIKKSPDTSEKPAENSQMVKEQRIRNTTGENIDVIITRSAFEMEGKNGLIYTVKDVSHHKDVQRELDLSMEKFKSIADRMSLGIIRCTLGREARFIEANNKAIRLLGRKSLQDLQEIHLLDLFSEKEEKKEVLKTLAESNVMKDRLLHIRKSDGSIIPVITSLFPVKDLNERALYCDGILLDAYEHLSHSNKFERPPIQVSASILLKSVSGFVKTAPICNADTSAAVASRLMTMQNADIILVVNQNNEPLGLVTHRDISRRVIAKGLTPDVPVTRIMSAPVISVSHKDLMVDAFSLMMEHKVSYVAVTFDDTRQYGYISLLALSELRKNTPEYLIHSIRKSESTEELAQQMKHLPELIENLVETGTGATMAGRIISQISDTVTIRFVDDALKNSEKPPCPFVFLALGSEGRREQTLATDQDNAIIFLSDKPDLHRPYFLELGGKVCSQLDKVGYPFCLGGVMAKNPVWCLSSDEIQEKVTNWISTPNPEELLNTGIFFDFRPVYGEFNLARNLQRFCLDQVRERSVFFYNLAQNTIAIKPKSAMLSKSGLSNIDKKQESIDIKEPLLAITSIIRLWALKYGVSEKNTLERILAMQSLNLISDSFADEFGQAYRFLTHLRLQNQLSQINGGNTPSNHLSFNGITESDRIMLKKIYTAISNHQARLATEFRIV